MEESREEFSWIEKIVDQYPRYKAEAYAFVMIVIDDIQESLEVRRHISGEVLLNGLKEYASSKYGPMAKEVLNSWGVYTTEDIGNIVFMMVKFGILDKTEEDSIEDFKEGFNFTTVFEEDYFNNKN